MECPICRKEVGSLPSHFRSMYRKFDKNKHKDFKRKYLNELTPFINSFFETSLTIREVFFEVKQRTNILLLNINTILKIWRDSFGEEQLKNRTFSNKSKFFKQSWNARDRDEKNSTITKWYTASLTNMTKRTYADGEGPSTLWGHAQVVEVIDDGVLNVSTARHGGILVSCEVAMKKLSPQARAIGTLFNGYYSYEEDCDWVIPLFENQDWIEKGEFPKDTVIAFVKEYHASYKSPHSSRIILASP